MRTMVVIPWRGGDAHRERSHDYVTDHLDECGLDWIDSDSDTDAPFSRAQAKNRGADEAVLRSSCDVVIFHDADMLIEPHFYEPLIEQAYTNDRLVIGYTEYRALTKAGTNLVLKGKTSPWRATVAGTTVGWSTGGIIAINAESFGEVGGYDERFRGWGCEDTAFAIACGTALGPPLRAPNAAAHLWHEHGKVHQAIEDERYNGKLLARYNQITGLDDLRSVQREEI